MTALEAIIFDFDGVIADSEPLHYEAFRRTLAGEGVELSREDYYTRYLGYDDHGFAVALARDRGLTGSATWADDFVARKGRVLLELLDSGAVLFPGAADFVRAAAARVPAAIASGARTHEILQIVEAAGLAPCFTVIVGADDTRESKPSPEPYRLAFARLREATGRELSPGRTVAIEDSLWGLESARGAGLRLVGVTTSYGAEELRDAELVASGLAALDLDALDALCAAPRERTA
jgi:HAD superfamily hydrolase (TIGR01509 family)